MKNSTLALAILAAFVTLSIAGKCYEDQYCLAHQSCCEVETRKYKCCGYINSWCCRDQRHCCPEHTLCINDNPKYCSNSTIDFNAHRLLYGYANLVPSIPLVDPTDNL